MVDADAAKARGHASGEAMVKAMKEASLRHRMSCGWGPCVAS